MAKRQIRLGPQDFQKLAPGLVDSSFSIVLLNNSVVFVKLIRSEKDNFEVEDAGKHRFWLGTSDIKEVIQESNA